MTGNMATGVKNFRPVTGLSRVYRCAQTEPLAEVTHPNNDAENIILLETGLIVDLRSEIERDDSKAELWMPKFGFTALEASAGEEIPSASCAEKRVMRVDVQSRAKIFEYITNRWLSKSQRAMVPLLEVLDTGKLYEMRIDALNQRGLAGLNEAILETGGPELCLVLQEITKHLESTDSSNVVFHCVQGKDRTGMLAMLCQSILKQSDDEIIEEYFKSEVMRDPSVAVAKVARGRFDKSKFAGAPREAMIETLEFVRERYGSVCPGYLDSIGFDQSWRDRFVASQQNIEQSKL